MKTKKQRKRKKLINEINVLRAKRAALTHDVEILKAHLLAGKREKNRRHIEECVKKQDFFPSLENIDV